MLLPVENINESFSLFGRYLVTHLMGADLNNIVKCQKLTDDHVQFLIYQIVRGLKVRFQERFQQFVEKLRPVDVFLKDGVNE